MAYVERSAGLGRDELTGLTAFEKMCVPAAAASIESASSATPLPGPASWGGLCGDAVIGHRGR